MIKNKKIALAQFVFLALLVTWLASPASAQIATPVPGSIKTIEVSGHGETRATPDQAMLDLAIETHGATAEEAAGQNADLSQKVVKALKEKLGDKGKIWTGGYNLYPDYEQKQ